MEERRPDPDDLLANLHRQDAAARRGRLEVYLGMCPGVGKTYAMLESAQEDHREGKRVLVGVVETHGRSETEALLRDLSVLPLRKADHRGMAIQDFDLDAALAARPQLILVDELAHTTAPGSRHSKRWQEVAELIGAGINVRTTINIQHIESLNDVVAQITGVRVRETVPDSVLEQADEVILVDLPPDELRERLEAGKVYLGAQAARAADGFFKPSNLVALRELALRFVASRVGKQVRLHRTAAGSSAIWPTQERVLVAVGPAPSSATLVRAAKRLATLLGADWFALFVETPRSLSPQDRARVAEHLQLAESLGAGTATFSATTVSDGLLQFARRENVTKLVVGKPLRSSWRELLRPSPVNQLVRCADDIDVYVIRGGTEEGTTAPPASANSETTGKWTFLAPVLATMGAVLVGKTLAGIITPSDIAMVFLLASACISFLGSRISAFLMAILGILAFNFFFIPPFYTLRVAGAEYLITFATLLAVSLVISELTLKLRKERDLARHSEERTAALYRFSTRLAEARGSQAIVATALGEFSTILHTPIAIVRRAKNGISQATGTTLNDKELAVASWVLDNARVAGRDTQTLSAASMTHHPLLGPRGIVGVISVGGPALSPRQQELLHALARHLALVLSVESIDEDRRRSAQEAETERLRSSILSSVSHDLRTPLASILGSASSLQEQGAALDEDTRHDLLTAITDEADRLNRLITNLLEMTKIEGGALRLKRIPLPVDEIVGAALRAVRRLSQGHAVATRIPSDLPFVDADELLVQQVLINLLENACKHTPAHTPIEIAGEVREGMVQVTVADRGPGLNDEDMLRLFDRFYRGARAGRGAGLGLAICKAIVSAHGGGIFARNREGGGAEFSFTLPIAPTPPLSEEDMEASEA